MRASSAILLAFALAAIGIPGPAHAQQGFRFSNPSPETQAEAAESGMTAFDKDAVIAGLDRNPRTV